MTEERAVREPIITMAVEGRRLPSIYENELEVELEVIVFGVRVEDNDIDLSVSWLYLARGEC